MPFRPAEATFVVRKSPKFSNSPGLIHFRAFSNSLPLPAFHNVFVDAGLVQRNQEVKQLKEFGKNMKITN